MSPQQIVVLPDPDGLAHPYAHHDNPVIGPGDRALTSVMAMTGDARYLVQVTGGAPHFIGTDGSYVSVTSMHMYRRDGDQWHHVFAQHDEVRYGGPVAGLRWSRDGNWLIVAVSGAYPMSVYDPGPPTYADYIDPENFAYNVRSRRLQIWRRDGDDLVLHGYSPDDAVIDPVQYGYIYADLAMDFDATGQWLALSGYAGLTGLMRFDSTAGTLTVTDGRTLTVTPADDPNDLYPDISANSALYQVWNPADPAELLRIDIHGQARIYRRSDAGILVLQHQFVDLVSINPGWHPSGRIVSLVHAGACGRLVPTLHAYPSGEILGTVAEAGGYSSYFSDAGIAFDPTGAYAGFGLTARVSDDGLLITLSSSRIGAFDPNGHPVPGTGTGDGGDPNGIGYIDPPNYSGFTLLDEPPPGHQAGGRPVWGRDPGGGGLYFAQSSENPFLVAYGYNAYYGLPQWASVWGLRLYRLGDSAPAAPQVRSVLTQVQPDGSVPAVGVGSQPLAQVLPDGSMRVWPDSTAPLYQKQTDGTWRIVVGVDAQ